MSGDLAGYESRDTRFRRALMSDLPPRPACFSPPAWTEWLLQALEAGEPIVRVSDTGKHTGRRVVMLVVSREIDYCGDCTADHKARMLRRDACHPPQVARQIPMFEDTSHGYGSAGA
jgi:hypothetical protein